MGRKNNPFNDNPFGKFDDEDTDPFQDHSVPQANSSSLWPAEKGSAWDGTPQPATIPLDNGFSTANGSSSEIQMDYVKRKDQLDQKEKELNEREAQLQKQETELRAAGGLKPKKNWPRFYPITNHDINGEVPEGNRRMVKYCYWAFLGFIFTLTWNWFGALLAMCVISPGQGRLVGFLLATVYWFAGLPGAWILWYMRIYNLAIRDRALVYAWFFLMFFIHIAFCVWSAISPPLPFTSDWSHTGFVTCIKAFDRNTFIGVIYVMGGSFWTLEILWSLWALKTVYVAFRSGSGPSRLKQEAAGAIAGRAIGGKSSGPSKASSSNKPNFGAGDV